jgi:hypothetical protein
VGESHVGALTGVRQGDRAADAGVTSGDEGAPSNEPLMTDVGVLTVIRYGLHGSGRTWGFLLLGWE